MIEDQQRPRYWLITGLISAGVALFAALCALVVPLFASTMNSDSLLGFPLGFYFAAQGFVIIVIVVVNWTSGRQADIDRKFGAIEDL